MRLAHASYDPETGISMVILQKGNERFTGVATLNEEDADVASSFAGCQFAETKARIKMLKTEYREEKKKYLVLKNLYKQMIQLKDFEELYFHTPPVRLLRKQLKIQESKMNKIKDNFLYLQENYDGMVEDRLSTARQLPQVIQQRKNMRENAKEGHVE